MSTLHKPPPWRSRLPNKISDKRVSFRMKAKMGGRVRAVLIFNGITMSEFIREAIERLLVSEERFKEKSA